jgi:hypothetical protein
MLSALPRGLVWRPGIWNGPFAMPLSANDQLVELAESRVRPRRTPGSSVASSPSRC